MEQDITGTGDTTDIPGNLPGERDQADNRERAGTLPKEPTDELLKEQAKEPALSGPATPGKGEDVVLFVETISFPEQGMEGSPEDMILRGIDLEVGIPWYRSRWVYVGTGLMAATALSIGAVLLLRSRSRSKRRLAVSQAIIKPTRRARRRRLLFQAAPRMRGRFSQWSNQLSGQASRFTGEAQEQFNRLAHRTPGAAATLNPLQRQRSARALLNRTRRQLEQFSTQTSEQLSALGSTTRTQATQTLNGIQENLAQLGEGVALGLEKTGASLKHGWKLGRNFTLGAAAGALWAMLFSPQSGETTRQRLAQPFQSLFRKQ